MMERIQKLIILISFLFHINSSLYGQTLLTAKPENVGLSSQRLERLTQAVQNHINKGELAGAVTLIARKGKIVQFTANGMMDIENQIPMQKDAIFRIASMSKLVTCVGAMILFEEGRFSLNDPVSVYIPEMTNFQVALSPETKNVRIDSLKRVPMEREITIRDLMRHTSGMAHVFGHTHVDELYKQQIPILVQNNLQDFVKKLPSLPLAHQPGTQWEYSFSIDVLGYLIEVISGQPLDQFLKTKIFTPLGLVDTDFYVLESKIKRLPNLYQYESDTLTLVESSSNSRFTKAPKRLSGSGGLVSTASDYARFLQMLLNGGKLDDYQLLSRKTVELMLRNHLVDISSGWLPPGVGFGLGPAVVENIAKTGELGSSSLFYWAGIYNTFFFVDPKEEMIGIFMTQMLPFRIFDLEMRFRRFCLQAVID